MLYYLYLYQIIWGQIVTHLFVLSLISSRIHRLQISIIRGASKKAATITVFRKGAPMGRVRVHSAAPPPVRTNEPTNQRTTEPTNHIDRHMDHPHRPPYGPPYLFEKNCHHFFVFVLDLDLDFDSGSDSDFDLVLELVLEEGDASNGEKDDSDGL